MSEAADELYSADPEEFIARRKGLAAQARAAGDRDAAKRIAGLGKPTRSASLVNHLVRSDPSVSARLAELSGQLHAGEAALDGAGIRKLSIARRELIDTLVREAIAQAGEPPPSAAVREELTSTFNAALADPDVAAQVAAGTVLRAASWAGFGPGIGTAMDPAAAFQLGPAAAKAPAPAKPAKTPPAKPPGKPAAKPAAKPAKRRPSPAERRERQRTQAEDAVTETTRAAEAAAAAERDQREAVRLVVEQHASDRERLTEAERAVADAREQLARAQRAVADTEREHADAEQRLARSRQTLARERDRLTDAGTQARQAAAALKRAKQALGRLQAQRP
ncbi:MAG TPA: hypothetical protein VFQ44_04590 [Streptosporangiaceae bacterium]|nr:hypothetical protein [Streptosporangiaceae bacterium]